MPQSVPYAAAIAFLTLRRQWVLETMEKQKQKYQDNRPATEAELAQLRAEAKAELPLRLATLAERYGFSYNRVVIKHNSTNWGSCSTKSNINLNLNIVRLPSALRDYVLLHELCHLRHHDHGRAFHLLLEHVLTDNLFILVDQGDPLAVEIAHDAARSKAQFPVGYTHTRQIRKYRLL